MAQDHCFGQPPGSQLRAAVLAQHLARALALDEVECATIWWVSTLRFLGCTGHAFETAAAFGDEIELPAVVSVLVKGKAAAQNNFHMACEVADMLADRLGMSPQVRAALATNFERWNGRGLPAGRSGADIPRPMRIAQLAHELEVLTRTAGPDQALAVIRERRGHAYDPELADMVLTESSKWHDAIEGLDPWDAALDVSPPGEPLDEEAVRHALLVLADFADLKSPWMGGHSRQVAALVAETCGPAAGAAALVHDLGRVAIPNTIWDKPTHLTRDERERVESHPLITDQLFRRLPFTQALAGSASAAHERLDGSGYHRRLTAGHLDVSQRVIAAADCYQAMTSDRPHRPALEPDAAAAQLWVMAADGRLDGEAVERVPEAAGHVRRARFTRPSGLTARECEVLRLVALGCTTRQVAEQLVISPKTADRHIQHIYEKIGISSRGAAALFAIESGVLPSDR